MKSLLSHPVAISHCCSLVHKTFKIQASLLKSRLQLNNINTLSYDRTTIDEIKMFPCFGLNTFKRDLRRC